MQGNITMGGTNAMDYILCHWSFTYNCIYYLLQYIGCNFVVFSIQGGMSPECAKFYSRLATLISEKRNDKKSTVTSWMRCRLNFSLLRSALLCIRGSRTIAYMQDTRDKNFDLSVSQAIIKQTAQSWHGSISDAATYLQQKNIPQLTKYMI